jgi:hypothetical protein
MVWDNYFVVPIALGKSDYNVVSPIITVQWILNNVFPIQYTFRIIGSMEPLPYWFASFGNISSSALICPIYFDGSIRLWILYYIYVFSDGESTEETLQQDIFDLWYIFHESSITTVRSLYLSFATYPTPLVSHLGVPNDYFLLTILF